MINLDPTSNQTPNSKLPPLAEGAKRKMVITIDVSANFENRLDNQWEVEREIYADRWSWDWADFAALKLEEENRKKMIRELHDSAAVLEAAVIGGDRSPGELHTIHTEMDTARSLRLAANFLDGVVAT
jgi:hypothetical protein